LEPAGQKVTNPVPLEEVFHRRCPIRKPMGASDKGLADAATVEPQRLELSPRRRFHLLPLSRRHAYQHSN
jgi:hypothetical protein